MRNTTVRSRRRRGLIAAATIAVASLALVGCRSGGGPASASLVAAAPNRSRLVLVGLIGHVEGQRPAGHRVADFVRLWGVCYELLAG